MNLVHKAKDYVTEKVADVKKPEASITDVDLKDVGRHGITYLAKVCVKNPYSVSIPVCDIKYSLKSADRRDHASVESWVERMMNLVVYYNGRGSLKAHEDTVLDVGIKVPHSVLVSLIKDIGADGDLDYLIEIKLIVDLPVIGNITLPLTQKGEMKLPSLSDLF
ncbi:desiccation protectant protein Lea14 [Dorcoceras hygrometricum]|uniref:Desiccation protectant protein Lea14 n=1 Tax=Dorcoceras hygrometricum TaxID=472368 RepID=A0A2Z6ZY07_9LAMI|nr:desiccation protectant protein Lea14 [Dorcoceras hygrometricum]